MVVAGCGCVGGVSTHSLDYKKSAGGFIHGHRYTGECARKKASKKMCVCMCVSVCEVHGWMDRVHCNFIASKNNLL